MALIPRLSDLIPLVPSLNGGIMPKRKGLHVISPDLAPPQGLAIEFLGIETNCLPSCPNAFASMLRASMSSWKSKGERDVLLKILSEQAYLVPIAIQYEDLFSGAVREVKEETGEYSFPGNGCFQVLEALGWYYCNASRDVDCCLIPESPFYLEGPGGLFEYIERRLKENGQMVLVIAEGAGQELLSESTQKNASGNKLLQDVALLISQRIKVCYVVST